MTVKKNTGPINCFKLSLLLKRIVIRFGNIDTILLKISSDQHKLMINVLALCADLVGGKITNTYKFVLFTEHFAGHCVIRLH
jgi:hypothetical protein